LDNDREGVLHSPEAENPKTFFSVWISLLEEPAVAEDMEELRQGIDEGLSQLPGCQVEAGKDDALSNLLKFERVYTFEENGATRKRKVWILYVDKWLMVVTWQGSSPEEYKYWYPMANYCFNTFTLPEALWFATDRDLAGSTRQQS